MDVSKVRYWGNRMFAYNVMEKIVEDELARLIETGSYKGCTCLKCHADIMALALNQLPPKYVVSEKGKLISQIEATLPQNKADNIAAVVAACKLVQQAPRHE